MRTSLLAFWLVVIVSMVAWQPIRLTLVGDLPEAARLALEWEGVPYQSEDNRTIIEVRDRDLATRALSRAYHTVCQRKTVAVANLSNYGTTKTADGEPYRRRSVILADDGGVKGIADDAGDFNWVYQPGHPESAGEGPHRGYVPLPNINLSQELEVWQQSDTEQRVLRELLEQLEPRTAFSQWDSSLDPGQREIVERLAVPRGPLSSSKAQPVDLSPPIRPNPNKTLSFRDLMWTIGSELARGETYTPFDCDWGEAQSSTVNSGPASVASALNWLYQGRFFTCDGVERKHGFALLRALKSESSELGLDWYDAGNLNALTWPDVESSLKLNRPAIVAIGGQTHATDRVLMLVGTSGQTVTYVDPASGALAEMDRAGLLNAPSHRDGNFVFLTRGLAESCLKAGAGSSAEL